MKVEYWDPETHEKVESKRDYDEYQVMAGYLEDDYYKTTRAVTLSIHVDTENGIMVKDVGAYEKWLYKTEE